MFDMSAYGTGECAPLEEDGMSFDETNKGKNILVMEYKKDKRTKNLTLRDIHVGDWVQVWSEQAERYSPPLKITQICDDGTIYLVTCNVKRPSL